MVRSETGTTSVGYGSSSIFRTHMKTPKLCHHKASQLGYVTLDGKEHYLGHWPRGQRTAPPAVRAEYDAIISR